MLTKKQIKRLWEAGNNDSYTNELLCEQAKDFIREACPEIKEDDEQLALEVYVDGFCGVNRPGQKEKIKADRIEKEKKKNKSGMKNLLITFSLVLLGYLCFHLGRWYEYDRLSYQVAEIIENYRITVDYLIPEWDKFYGGEWARGNLILSPGFDELVRIAGDSIPEWQKE